MAMRTVLFHEPRLRAAAGIVLLVAVWAVLCLSSASAREPYRIGYTPGVLISMEAKERLVAAYERAGVPVEFVPLPQKRSLYLAAEGSLDGDAGRIAGLENQYPSMVRVNVKLMDFYGAAYVVERQDIAGFRDELLDTMKAGSLCGVVWAEKVMRGRCLEHVNTYEALFGMLLEGRIDIALGSKSSAEAALADNGTRYRRIRQLEPVVYRTSFYHYLHIRNAEIVPQLEKALHELRAQGHWGNEK